MHGACIVNATQLGKLRHDFGNLAGSVDFFKYLIFNVNHQMLCSQSGKTVHSSLFSREAKVRTD